jgi:hypothetical protein
MRQPKTRATLVAPMFPLPETRRSTSPPYRVVTTTPNGTAAAK